MNIILRYKDTICVCENGHYYAIYANGTRSLIQSKLDILPITPARRMKERKYNRRLKKSV